MDQDRFKYRIGQGFKASGLGAQLLLEMGYLQVGLDPHHDLFDVKRLGNEIHTAGFKAPHLVVHFA
jgi:hypothetical protein